MVDVIEEMISSFGLVVEFRVCSFSLFSRYSSAENWSPNQKPARGSIKRPNHSNAYLDPPIGTPKIENFSRWKILETSQFMKTSPADPKISLTSSICGVVAKIWFGPWSDLSVWVVNPSIP
jgi:hypothetical protein